MYLVLQISCIWIQLCGERALNIVTKGHYLRPNLNSIDVNALIGIGLILCFYPEVQYVAH